MHKRIVFHIDVNSAFLSWSAAHHLLMGGTEDYRQMDAVVAKDGGEGRGIILAKSESVKKMGVKTGEAIWIARQKCPTMKLIPPDYDLYLRSSTAMQQILSEYSSAVEPFSIDECFLDYTGQEKFFGAPNRAAFAIKERIKKELGFTVNIGIGSTKALAKMASEFEKPDRVHTLWRREIPEKLWPLPVEELFMAGRKTVVKLKKIGLLTIGDVAQADLELITHLLGKHGETLWTYSNGLDDEPVREGEPPPPKSISKSITLPRAFTRIEEAEKVLLYIADALSHKLYQKGMEGLILSVAVKDRERHYHSNQKRPGFALSHGDGIYKEALPLLHAIWPGEEGVRYIALAIGALRTKVPIEKNLFDENEAKSERLDAALYALRSRYGRDIVVPAALINSGVDTLFRSMDEDDQETLPPRFF